MKTKMITEVLEFPILVYSNLQDEELSPELLEVVVDIHEDGQYRVKKCLLGVYNANMPRIYEWNDTLEKQIKNAVDHIVANWETGPEYYDESS